MNYIHIDWYQVESYSDYKQLKSQEAIEARPTYITHMHASTCECMHIHKYTNKWGVGGREIASNSRFYVFCPNE